MSAEAFRALLEAGDVDGLRKAWLEVSPHLPQPHTREQAEVVMHMTRTSSDTVAFKYRAYSHYWLLERGHPSQLPDTMRKSADRMYPRAVSAVGISVNSNSPILQPVVGEVRSAMEYAVLEAEADGMLENSDYVQQRMLEAKDRTYRALLGRRP